LVLWVFGVFPDALLVDSAPIAADLVAVVYPMLVVSAILPLDFHPGDFVGLEHGLAHGGLDYIHERSFLDDLGDTQKDAHDCGCDLDVEHISSLKNWVILADFLEA
jgi:hypothetical protein